MTCRLCGAGLTAEDSYDICDTCGMKIARRYKERLLWEERDAEDRARRKRHAAELERREREAASRPPLVAQPAQLESVVYYVQLGEWIKIGYSKNLRARLHQLRAEPGHVLAVEPGGRSIEEQRHQQFAHLRPRAKWENFAPAEDLAEHIAALREQHGIPDWLNPPRVNRRSRNTPVVVRRANSA